MNTLLIALIFSSSPLDIYKVDIIEYNSLISDNGEFIFDQWIFWKFKYNEKTKSYRYELLDWRLARNTKVYIFENFQKEQRDANREWCKKYPNGKFIMWPDVINWKLSHDSNGYLLIFNDPKCNNRITKVRSKLYKETYSSQDPELWEREFTSQKDRKNILLENRPYR